MKGGKDDKKIDELVKVTCFACGHQNDVAKKEKYKPITCGLCALTFALSPLEAK